MMIRRSISLLNLTWIGLRPPILFFAVLLWPACLEAQTTVVRIRSNDFFADAIFAQAAYLRAQGDFLKSAAEARDVSARAESQEMKNSVEWVNTYFERRKLYREHYAEENPSYMEKEALRAANRQKLISENPQTALSGNVADEMNWMLRELLTKASPTLFMPGHPNSLISSPDDIELSKSERHHLRVSESKTAGGRVMVFRADSAELLETRWPLPLRDDAFDLERKQFHMARDAALADLKAHHELDKGARTRLMQAVDSLSNKFNQTYPLSRRTSSPGVYLEYLSSKRFLQALALSTYRLIESESEIAFDESYRFSGTSVGQLIQHMLSHSLQFAPPEVGDEGAYLRTFVAIRTLYLKAVPAASAGKGR